METQTIERTDTDERVDDGTDSDIPKYFHYVKKDKIAESAVMGTHVVALCGEVSRIAYGGGPLGGGMGRIMKLGAQPVNLGLQFYGNAVHPPGGSSWTMRLSIAFLFPVKPKA